MYMRKTYTVYNIMFTEMSYGSTLFDMAMTPRESHENINKT